MGIISKWLEKRRQKELDRINREIELLKKRGLDYGKKNEKRDKLIDEAGKGHKINRDANFKLLFIIGLCLIVITGITLFYRYNLSALKTEYDEKLSQVELLTNDLLNKSSSLEYINSKLDLTKRAEDDLSKQYLELEGEKEVLSNQVNALNENIKQKNTELDSLKQDIQKKDKEIKDLKDCITGELDSSLSVCGF